MKDSTKILLKRTTSTIIMVSLVIWAFLNLTNDGLWFLWFACQCTMIYEATLTFRKFSSKNRAISGIVLFIALFVVNLKLQPQQLVKKINDVAYLLNKKKISKLDAYVPKMQFYSALALLTSFQILIKHCNGHQIPIEVEAAYVTGVFAAITLICFCSSFIYLLLSVSRWLVVFQIAVVALNDTGAYLGGRSLGRRFFKQGLISVSPSKTIEGYIAGGIASIIGAIVLSQQLGINRKLATAFGIYVAINGPLGGFYGSLVKRGVQIKDFGWIIPGHGGLIDRLDCQLISAPILWIALQIKW